MGQISEFVSTEWDSRNVCVFGSTRCALQEKGTAKAGVYVQTEPLHSDHNAAVLPVAVRMRDLLCHCRLVQSAE